MDRDLAMRVVAERLAAGIAEQPNGCHEWMKHRDSLGYGIINIERKRVRVHRTVWQLANGPIPAGMVICHRCDNPPCALLEHLWIGTVAENNADRDAKGRTVYPQLAVTHCPQGHAYDEANTHTTPKGARKCRACARAWAKARYHRLNLKANYDPAKRRARYLVAQAKSAVAS
jgi:hypothetical protein